MIKKFVVFSIIGVLALTLTVSGVAYSFADTVNGTNSEDASSVLINDNGLKIIFKGDTLIKANYLRKNEEVSKTFTVENTSTGAVNYNIVWNYIDNGYIDKDGLTYSLLIDGIKKIDNELVPISGSNIPILKNITLEKGETTSYTLIIKYKELKKHNEQTFDAKIGVVNNEEQL